MPMDDEVALIITCPSTGKPVRTGMSMNKHSFQKALIGAHEVRCPHCGQVHVWSKKDAHLAGEPPYRRAALKRPSSPNVPTCWYNPSRMTTSPEELSLLHSHCLAALRDYISQANKTCRLLAKVTEHPVSLEMRQEILEQRKAENNARGRYMEIRDRALRLATEAETDML